MLESFLTISLYFCTLTCGLFWFLFIFFKVKYGKDPVLKYHVVKKDINPNSKGIVQMSKRSSGFDIRVFLDEKFRKRGYYMLMPHEFIKLNTGVKFDIPKGYEIQVRPRSGLSTKGIEVSFGTVDEDYTGEIGVNIFNRSNKNFKIEEGMRLAQIVLCEKVSYSIKEIEVYDKMTLRGDRGFGSSGLK